MHKVPDHRIADSLCEILRKHIPNNCEGDVELLTLDDALFNLEGLLNVTELARDMEHDVRELFS